MTSSQETPSTWRPAWVRVLVLGLTIALIAITVVRTLDHYHAFRSGWSWDLAYYNQWYWSLLFGDRTLTVRPMAVYAIEGPSIWKMNYLSPLRFLLIPIYYLAPDPRTLLVIHSVLFWLVVPAAFTLVRSETHSDLDALLAAMLVPFTPLLWPLAVNDFREIQLCLPFVLWGVQGVRSRNIRLTAFGIAGMFACRQEMAVVAATFAFLPAREAEDFSRTIRWGRGLLLCGLLWFLLFVLYLRFFVGSTAPELYLSQFTGPKAGLGETLKTATAILFIGMGGFALLMMLAPRVSLLAAPWLWGLASGKFALRFLETEQWHEVRYTVPFVATALAAGLIGFARLTCWGRLWSRDSKWGVALDSEDLDLGLEMAGKRPIDLQNRERYRSRWLNWALIVPVLASSTAHGYLRGIIARQPIPMAADEVAAVWRWIKQVGPDEGVLAHYDVTAPLSSRRLLYSDVLDHNRPPHYPTLPPTIRWVFHRSADPRSELFLSQGFRVVHKGSHFKILRREASAD